MNPDLKINSFTLAERIEEFMGEVDAGHPVRALVEHHLGVCYEVHGKLPFKAISEACDMIDRADTWAQASDGEIPRTASLLNAEEIQHCLSTLWACREVAEAAQGETP